ncbi:MAG: rpfG1 [Clostridia bacterium]|nr:rpfG1 [Clostridia bacterium]
MKHNIKIVSLNEIDKNIKKLCTLLNYDIIAIINFNNGYQLATSTEILLRKNNEYITASDRWIKVLNTSTKHLLALLTEQQQVLFYSADVIEYENYLPLIENIEKEIYIPIFQNTKNTNALSKDLIGCIYISTFDCEKNVQINQLIQGDVYNTIYILDKLCVMKYLGYKKNESVFNLVNVMSEMTLESDPLAVLHPYAVAQFASQIADVLALDDFTKEEIYFASLLHDIGKIYIDINILRKETSLTDKEYITLKNHSIYGANIIKSITSLDDISFFVKHHHERYDGAGYPDGLKGESIPLQSRIICIADAIDAMLSQRVYKPSRSDQFVIRELLQNKGKQFDPELVDIAIDILSNCSEETFNPLSSFITWSTLTLITTCGTYSIQGTLMTYGFGHFFKSNKFNFLSAIGDGEVIDAILFMHTSHNTILECQAHLDFYEENQVYISHIKSPL